jgi:hypothetical protein
MSGDIAATALIFYDIAGIKRRHFYRGSTERLDIFLRRPLAQKICPVMHGIRKLRLDQFARRISSVSRVHGKMAADRNQNQVGLLILADEFHVAEYAGCRPCDQF